MSKELFVKAEEVARELGISKPYAYKLVREMNEELKQKGFITIPGRVSRRYFEEKFYGLRDEQYILVGVGIGALIHNWIPESWIETVLGSNNPFGVILATIVGIPMYADIFGTIPVAEALLSKGAQLGTVLSFMMAVTTLSLPSLIMLRKAVKPKLLALFIGVCAVGIILVGYLFNAFQFILI